MNRTRFASQLDLESVSGTPGRYRTELSDAWNCPVVPQGGIATAVAVRALAFELDEPEQPLRSVTNVFAAPVPAGPVEIDVTVLRRGRSMSQATATLRAAGSNGAGHTCVAVFGGVRDGFEFTDVAMPDVPPPQECPSWRDVPNEVGLVPFNFWEHVEGRAASGHAPWEDYVPTTSERAAWFRFDEPPFTDDGELDPLALVTLCDTMPGAVGERMGPGPKPWLPPSADLTVHVLGRATSEWLLAHNRARHAGDGYASVELELWDPERGLAAYATQMMFFTFPEGPPPPEHRRPQV
jgi:acyl-CoA thioesterase